MGLSIKGQKSYQVPSLKYVKGPSKFQNHLQRQINQPNFVIQNSSLGESMECQLQPDGGVRCETDGECVSFNVEELTKAATKAKYIEPDYFDNEFGESEKKKEQSFDFWAFSSVIEMALVDYDKFNFVQKKFEEGVSQKVLRKFMPELASRDLEGV